MSQILWPLLLAEHSSLRAKVRAFQRAARADSLALRAQRAPKVLPALVALVRPDQLVPPVRKEAKDLPVSRGPLAPPKDRPVRRVWLAQPARKARRGARALPVPPAQPVPRELRVAKALQVRLDPLEPRAPASPVRRVRKDRRAVLVSRGRPVAPLAFQDPPGRRAFRAAQVKLVQLVS